MSDSIPTTYHIYYPDRPERETREIAWPRQPGFDRINELFQTILPSEPLEHVSVLFEGKPADMFVSVMGHQPLGGRAPLRINHEATAIYRAASLRADPGRTQDSLPKIAGIAVVFTRRVWF